MGNTPWSNETETFESYNRSHRIKQEAINGQSTF